ncbi:class I SAM-dependent methyltransferase [Micromonospora echinospora]
MLTWEPSSYGDVWADEYDIRFAGVTDTGLAVAALFELAGDGPVLELGPGTGRLSIPLADAGLEVHGVEASAKMVAKILGKPGGEDLQLTQASFENFALGREFSLIFVSCNTLFDLPTQQAQLSCIRSSSRHLRPDGAFVIEASVPWQMVKAASGIPTVLTLGEASAVVQAVLHSPKDQQLFKQRVTLDQNTVRYGPVRNRYIWPSELDLMAQIAGLELQDRWSGWEYGDFTDDSTGHVSVYRKPRAFS